MPSLREEVVRAARIRVTGVVQGVGFRPFVYGLATGLELAGWVRNTSGGVEIEVEGGAEAIERFVLELRERPPPLARISAIDVTSIEARGLASFRIEPSAPVPGAMQPVPPDVAVCDDCRRETLTPGDRRYRYPFTNCTNCGPRFTIIVDLPYDRPNTTMAGFPLCPDCGREYADPLDRRFHAQPIACPRCGPTVWLEAPGRDEPIARADAALRQARRLLAEGRIVAVKGLGGFHLACNALDEEAVAELRRRKLRVGKPFGLMLRDLETVRAHCLVGDAEAELLLSAAAPIVLLRRRPRSTIARAVAPEGPELGVMLPYTPLHLLLFEAGADAPEALVMTSGNLAEEPIATGNDEARLRLASLCDALLLHDRPIRTRCDDSVTRVVAGSAYHLRRSRGFAPYPVALPVAGPHLLACGAELKCVFAVSRGSDAFLSHHVGDLENLETLRAFEDGVRHLEKLFRVAVECVAVDRHPDYLATRYGRDRAAAEGLALEAVQHHHAHVAACMADNGVAVGEPVIGLAFDGTGYGDDGAVWGGEVLLATYSEYRRLHHLRYVGLPGGDAATRQPWRVALAWLEQAGIEWEEDLPPVRASTDRERSIVAAQIAASINTPPTSSMGRLFDAVASLAGLHQRVTFEAQAAMALEAIADVRERGAYDLPIDGATIDPRPLVAGVVADVRAGVSPAVVAARFHNALADMALEVCRATRDASGVDRVALTGGVWQNATLLAKTRERLQAGGFEVLIHRQVPANDGGIALGQAAVAACRTTGS